MKFKIPTKKEKILMNFKIEKELKTAFQKECTKEGLSLSSVLVSFIEQFLESRG